MLPKRERKEAERRGRLSKAIEERKRGNGKMRVDTIHYD
jgi:hypothetical protein